MQILELLFSLSSFYDRTNCCKEDDQDENTESKQHRKHAKTPSTKSIPIVHNLFKTKDLIKFVKYCTI